MLFDEQPLSLSDAAKALPRINGKRPHSSTLWRWARKGLQGVKLETRRLGGRFVTSIEALERFSKQLAEIELPDSGPVLRREKSRTEHQRQLDIESAEKYLDARGV